MMYFVPLPKLLAITVAHMPCLNGTLCMSEATIKHITYSLLLYNICEPKNGLTVGLKS